MQVIRRATDRITATGELAEDCYDPDVEYKAQPDGPVQTIYRGLPGLHRSLDSLKEAWAEIGIEVRELIETDEAVVAVLHFQLRGHASGIELEVDQGWAVWMRAGKIRRIEQHATRQDALDAVGGGRRDA